MSKKYLFFIILFALGIAGIIIFLINKNENKQISNSNNVYQSQKSSINVVLEKIRLVDGIITDKIENFVLSGEVVPLFITQIIMRQKGTEYHTM